MSEKNKITNTSLFAIPLFFACLFGSTSTINTNIVNLQNTTAYYEMLNTNRNNANNMSISMDMINDNDILTQRSIKTLVNCINEEPADLGTEVSYLEYYKTLRNQDDYFSIFNVLINEYPVKFTNSLINILSQVDFQDLNEFEKTFVIDNLTATNLSTQEYALNTLSLWDISEIIPKICNTKFKNKFLQRRFDNIISFYKRV